MKKIIILTFVLAILSVLMIPVFANAQLGSAISNLRTAAGPTGLKSDLPTTVGTVINVVLSLVGTVFLALTIYAGMLWMTAGGAEERINKAKSILSATIIGLIIVMSAYAITYFVTTKLGGSNPSGTGSTGASGTGCCVAPDGTKVPASSPSDPCTGGYYSASC